MKPSVIHRKNPWTDKDVENHWDKVSNIYVEENNRVKKAHDQRFSEAAGLMDLPSGTTVLNVSSRDCEAEDYLKKVNPDIRIIHAEISSGLIREAANIRPGAEQVKISTYSELPFENEKFDRIVSLETLEHVAEPVKFLQELYRVSVNHARMVLSCPPLTAEPAYRIYTFLFGGHGEGPHRFLRSGEVKKLFEHTGWKLTMHKGTVLIPVGPECIQNLGEKLISRFQHTFISELGIRQFYVCEKI